MADNLKDPQNTLFGAAFQALSEAACILEPVYDGAGAITDWRYLAANRRIADLIGLCDIAGQTLRGRWPNMAEGWMQEFAQAFATGEPVTVIRNGSEDMQIYETILTPL